MLLARDTAFLMLLIHWGKRGNTHSKFSGFFLCQSKILKPADDSNKKEGTGCVSVHVCFMLFGRIKHLLTGYSGIFVIASLLFPRYQLLPEAKPSIVVLCSKSVLIGV